MAPARGRRGETRMDAAIDALVPMGFSKPDIRRTVRGLLKVYGGTDGWVFIEEASYKLLIEALLAGEGGSDPGPPLLMNEAANEENMHDDAGSSSAAGPSNAAEIPLDMVPQSMDAEKTCADGGSHQDSVFSDGVSFPQQDLTNATENIFPSQTQHNPPPKMVYPPPLSPPPPPPETEYAPPPPPPPPLSPPLLPPPPPVDPAIPRINNFSPRKRKPCYGWWGEETEDFVYLPLMPVPRGRDAREQRNVRA